MDGGTELLETGGAPSEAADTVPVDDAVEEAGAVATDATGSEKKTAGAKRAAIAVAVVIAVAAVGGIAAVSATQPAEPATEQEASTEKVIASEEEEAATVEVGIAQTADAMDESTSPTIVHFKGASGDAEGVDFYHATPAKEAMAGNDSVELAEGSYEVEFLPTVNSDGSINKGTGDKPQDLDIDASDDMERVVAIDSETTAADKVTADQIADVQKATAEAVAKGDETLTGDAGEKVAEKVAENASKAPAADKEKVEEAKQEAADAAQDAKGQETASSKKDTGSTGSSTSGSKTDSNKQQTSQKADSGKVTSSSSGSSSSSSSQSGSTAKKEHTHTWVAVTHEEPVYETRTRTVTDQAATKKKVWSHTEYHTSDGQVFNDYDSVVDYAFEKEVSWKDIEVYDTIEVPAVTHEESYQVQTGTKTVTDGYRCSGCGATK